VQALLNREIVRCVINAPEKPRWYRLTPDRCLILLLAVEGFLLLSERFGWFGFCEGSYPPEVIARVSVFGTVLFLLFWFVRLLVGRRLQFSVRVLLLGLLAVEGFLRTAEVYGWFGFPEQKGWAVLIALASVGVATLLLPAWLAVSLIFRLRFQFSLRSLLVLTVAVALPCSWLAVEMKQAREQRDALEAVRQMGGAVGYVGFHPIPLRKGGEPATPVWLQTLLGRDFFTGVHSVSFRNTRVGDGDLEHLAGLPRLQTLDLSGTRISDAGLARLKRFTRLQSLRLDGTEVTGPGLEHLQALAQLFSLALADTPVTGVGLEHLKTLGRLRYLDLSRTMVTDAGLEHVEELTGLWGLDLSGTGVADAGLAHLQGLTQLESLHLQNTKVTGPGLEHLAGMAQLRTLDLASAPVTDVGLEHLKTLGRLQDLNLPWTKVTDAGVEHLEGLTQLQSLSLFATKVSDAGVEHLQGLTRLRSLFIAYTKVSDEGVKKLQQALPNCRIMH
jgi:hypothetical protein